LAVLSEQKLVITQQMHEVIVLGRKIHLDGKKNKEQQCDMHFTCNNTACWGKKLGML
jgi:hypothetical protein